MEGAAIVAGERERERERGRQKKGAVDSGWRKLTFRLERLHEGQDKAEIRAWDRKSKNR